VIWLVRKLGKVIGAYNNEAVASQRASEAGWNAHAEGVEEWQLEQGLVYDNRPAVEELPDEQP